MDEALIKVMLEAEGVDPSALDAVIKITRFTMVGALRAFQGDLKSIMEDLELVAQAIEAQGLPANCGNGGSVGSNGTAADSVPAGGNTDSGIIS